MTAVFIVAAALAALVLALWLIGAREPVYRIASAAPAWFVALRGGDARAAGGAQAAWRADADLSFIGSDEPYWSAFLIFTGGGDAAAPLTLSGAIEDAFIAKVKLLAPPRIALGLIRLLTWISVLPKPRGEVRRETESLGFRADLMPSEAAIARLLAKPLSYAPAMVNFLAYFGAAKYADGEASSGRAAYRRYGNVAMRTVFRTGGALLFYGVITDIVREAAAGSCAGRWDDVAAMRYPSPPAILSMEHAPDYRAALHHRDAGLERTVVIASTPRIEHTDADG